MQQNHNKIVSNKSFHSVSKYNYLETRLTYRNMTHEDIIGKINSGNACYCM
jgi:hypothetical protein